MVKGIFSMEVPKLLSDQTGSSIAWKEPMLSRENTSTPVLLGRELSNQQGSSPAGFGAFVQPQQVRESLSRPQL